ncbi:tRNA pseudouridine13 synthase, partial [Tremellales sp. Uapishka_1]
GGRGGASGPSHWWDAGDTREVVSQLIPNKDRRATAHKVVRELFRGAIETSSRVLPNEEGQRVVLQWSTGRDTRKGGAGDEKKLNSRGKIQKPPYIHFTLHKSNRETQDCLMNLARLLGTHQKELSVCGTKDKRAVTVQRVCLKRGRLNLGDVWRAINGIKMKRRTEKSAMEERGERGCRIGDLSYSTEYLELGMLKGNHFLITLRNVEAENEEDIDVIMASLRDHGFINFYGVFPTVGSGLFSDAEDSPGMQRFGTSSVPTHVTGLLLLQGKWAEAVESILSLREGEHPDCLRARLAWLEDGDYLKALEIMPRRCVAERCIWEYYKKGGDPKDKLGTMGQIPRNMRTIYVHAYQSYLWNLVVSARIKLSATEPMVGDLVFATPDAEDIDPAVETVGAKGDTKGRTWATTSSQEVKVLAEEDLPNYTIFDVVMPLPGWNVDYPKGKMAQMYFDIMEADGLQPNNMRRDQREYSLPGSYRRIINKPTNLSWSHIRYTDPDLALVQSDEDKLLGFIQPAQHDPNGKFRALQISMTLGTSAYATMMLREITREETAVWHQMGLTNSGADQEHKGTVKGDGEVDEDGEGEGVA